MDRPNWTDLNVVDSEGDNWGNLGDIVRDAPANLDNAEIVDGAIEQWPGYFMSRPGEDANWDTPAGAVDWAGFEDALASSRGGRTC